MHTTGNAGGSHNLRMFDNNSHAGNDLNEMLKIMGNGLFVTELMGQGVNTITGDYSRGASGFWIQNGQISFPVYEITIAGNLKEMFQNILSIGTDEYRRGSKTTGSVLIEKMTIGGS
jgi:PmbA protein